MVYRLEALIASRFLRGSESDVVSLNERNILRLIWRNPSFSRSEITAHTDLTQQSIYQIVDRLTERGIISLGVPKPGLGKGQPRPMLRLDGSLGYCCGMSVNPDVIDICLMHFAGTVLAESSVALREHSNG